ncbi:MAG: MBL fold metallo-hydrolase [Gaiellaceae bacterium]
MDEVAPGIRRLTLALPFGIDHVHCYFVRRESGGWLLVDTGLGGPAAMETWRGVLAELSGAVELIFVTHFHPDHVGAAGVVAGLTGAPVVQGRLDYEQCLGAWGAADARARTRGHLEIHGMPADEAEAVAGHHARLVGAIQFARDPELVDPGDRVDGWETVHLPGHADGHLSLLRDGILIAGDALLAGITPNVGIYHGSRPDPLDDYLDSLGRIARLGPRLALAGHGPAIPDPAGRARDIAGHHRERLEQIAHALDGRPRSAYDVSLSLFPGALPPALRRMALAESLAHLEHLALRGEIARAGEAERVLYQAG